MEETFTWVITKTEVRWVRSGLGTKALAERVAALRCGLNAALWNGGGAQDKCVAALKGAQPRRETIDGQVVDVLPFDLRRSTTLQGSAGTGRGRDQAQAFAGGAVGAAYQPAVPCARGGGAGDRDPDQAGRVSQRNLACHAPAHHRVALGGVPQNLAPVRQGEPRHEGLPGRRQSAARRATEPSPMGRPRQEPAGVAHANQQCTKEKGTQQTQHLAQIRGRPSAGASATPFRGGQVDIEEVRAWTPLPETAEECARSAAGSV